MEHFAAYLGLDWSDQKNDVCLVDTGTGEQDSPSSSRRRKPSTSGRACCISASKARRSPSAWSSRAGHSSQQGHKVKANEPYIEHFVRWIEGLGLEPNQLYGGPQLRSEFEFDDDIRSKCSKRDLDEDENKNIIC